MIHDQGRDNVAVINFGTQRVAETKVSTWTIATVVEGLPQSLPDLRVTVRVIGNPEEGPVTAV